MTKTATQEKRFTEAEWRTVGDFRKYWNAFCDADIIPIDRDDFTERLEAAGYVELRPVTRRDIAGTSFAGERGIELGGFIWVLTAKGRTALASTDGAER